MIWSESSGRDEWLVQERQSRIETTGRKVLQETDEESTILEFKEIHVTN